MNASPDAAPLSLARRAALLATATSAATLAGCASVPLPQLLPTADQPPSAPREWRAAWVASVAHIDWPSRAGLSVAEQQGAARELLDQARAIGLNALILQVRPAGDALYVSALEPWSEYLTGAQGRPPQPAWDPLAFWLEEASRRGIELHAWLNPYRARHPTARSPLVSPHLGVVHPPAVKTYGDLQWMDPAEPAAMQRTLAVVTDIARRYPLAGLHIDDYFYPYPLRQGDVELPFPDRPAWHRYLALAASQGGALSREDWRREQVDRLVQEMHRVVREARPGMAFGVSPFGLGRPDRRPPGVTGF
ncbi:MAG: family 10 glycosylhydrolase, partial [Gemmatimonadetes bacterium]|nr:family 10 glycosylhydrolase [Gemmatimonadota bacterium]